MFSGDFCKTAVTGNRASPCADETIIFGGVVGPDDDLAAVTGADCINVDGRVWIDSCEGCIGYSSLTMHVATHQYSAATRIARCVDGCARQLQMIAKDLNRTAGLTRSNAGSIQRTADIDLPDLHVTHQLDNTANIPNSARFNNSCVVHHCGAERIGSLGRQDYLPAIGLNQLVVLGQGVERTHIGRVRKQRAVADAERDLVTGSQQRSTRGRGNGAIVADCRTEQSDIAPICRVEGALILNSPIYCATVIEDVVARIEIGIGHAQRGGDQCTDIHLRGAAKQNAAGIKHKYLAIGVQVAEEGSGITIQYAIQCDRRCAGLVELHGLTADGIEALPVDGKVLGGLIYGSGVCDCLVYRARTRTNRAANRLRICRQNQDGLYAEAEQNSCGNSPQRRCMKASVFVHSLYQNV